MKWAHLPLLGLSLNWNAPAVQGEYMRSVAWMQAALAALALQCIYIRPKLQVHSVRCSGSAAYKIVMVEWIWVICPIIISWQKASVTFYQLTHVTCKPVEWGLKWSYWHGDLELWPMTRPPSRKFHFRSQYFRSFLPNFRSFSAYFRSLWRQWGTLGGFIGEWTPQFLWNYTLSKYLLTWCR